MPEFLQSVRTKCGSGSCRIGEIMLPTLSTEAKHNDSGCTSGAF